MTDEDVLKIAEMIEPDIGCSVFRSTVGELCVEWSQDAVLEFARRLELEMRPRCDACKHMTSPSAASQFGFLTRTSRPHCTYLNMPTADDFGCVRWEAR